MWVGLPVSRRAGSYSGSVLGFSAEPAGLPELSCVPVQGCSWWLKWEAGRLLLWAGPALGLGAFPKPWFQSNQHLSAQLKFPKTWWYSCHCSMERAGVTLEVSGAFPKSWFQSRGHQSVPLCTVKAPQDLVVHGKGRCDSGRLRSCSAFPPPHNFLWVLSLAVATRAIWIENKYRDVPIFFMKFLFWKAWLAFHSQSREH